MQGKPLKVIKISRSDNGVLGAEEVTLIDDLDHLYKEINCGVIDIIQRYIGGVLFDIVIDDEGALKNDLSPSSIWFHPYGSSTNEYLFGTLLLCHSDQDGELIDINLKDLQAVNGQFFEVRDPFGKSLNVLFHYLPPRRK